LWQKTGEVKKVIGKIVLVLGVLGLLLGGLVMIISLLLPTLTDGRTSMDEAILGVIPGAIVLFLSVFVTIIGLIIVLKQRKKA
jgi:hypothetical protein